jgi:hypothetical protein
MVGKFGLLYTYIPSKLFFIYFYRHNIWSSLCFDSDEKFLKIIKIASRKLVCCRIGVKGKRIVGIMIFCFDCKY